MSKAATIGSNIESRDRKRSSSQLPSLTLNDSGASDGKPLGYNRGSGDIQDINKVSNFAMVYSFKGEEGNRIKLLENELRGSHTSKNSSRGSKKREVLSPEREEQLIHQ